MEVFLYLLPLILALVFPVVLAHAIFRGMTFTVDTGHLRVRVYGYTARKVALSDIEWAAQDWCFWNEHYTNTVNPKKLVLLRRRTEDGVGEHDREDQGQDQREQIQEDLHGNRKYSPYRPRLNPKPSPRWTAPPLRDCLSAWLARPGT